MLMLNRSEPEIKAPATVTVQKTVQASGWQTLLCVVSFLMAVPLALVMMIHPALMLDAQGHYSHPMLMLVMLGISAGFVHGVGFVPKLWVWRYLFSPYVGWPLMLIGYWMWLIK